MPQSWRILADDLTGALDTVSAWGCQIEVPVFLDTPAASAQPVQAVATGTRDVPPAELPARLAPCLDWLAGAEHAFKKIDSLLRGNTFREVAWLLHSGRFAGAVLAPAYPAQGRFTAQGRHWVTSPHQPYGPRSHEHPEPLAQALAGVGLRAQLVNRPGDCLRHPGQLVIPDLLSDADLDQLAEQTDTPQARGWLWCGNAGLAGALARRRAATANAPLVADCGPGRPLLLTASRHPVLREQLYHLAARDLPIDLIDLAHAAALAPQHAQLHLAERMADLVAHHPRPPMLVVIGGDTLLALCRAAGVRSLQAGPSPRAGWGRARLQGGLWDGLCCYSRSGAFGAPDDLGELLALLTRPRAPAQELLK